MDVTAYLRILRRRWLLVLVPAVAALGLSWLTLPDDVDSSRPVAASYTARATLIPTPDLGIVAPQSIAAGETGLSMTTVSLFTTVGEVPEMAARTLGYDGEPQVLASQLQVVVNPDNGTLEISTTGAREKETAATVRAFSDAVVEYFAESQDEVTRARIAALEDESRRTTNEIRRVQAEVEGSPDPVLSAQLSALQGEYASQYTTLKDLRDSLGGPGPLQVLQQPVAIPQASSGFVAPTNPLARIAIAVLLGAVLGAALALVVERVDSRIRTRDQAEDAYGLPVLAEIPALPWSSRHDREVVSFARPASSTAEGYRALRSSVLLLGHAGGFHNDPDVPVEPTVIMVTSALAGEGKTTTVANLAAVMAEAGRSVIALGLDLRNPRLHEYFDVPNGTGISDLLAADRGERLDQVLRETQMPGVRVATSGQHLSHPGALLASVGPLVAAARAAADVVIVDSAPMLTVSDAVDLAPLVDVALVVTRLNSTTTGHAAATQRLLSRLGVPALGTVLIGAGGSAVHEYRFGPAWRGASDDSTPDPGGHQRPRRT